MRISHFLFLLCGIFLVSCGDVDPPKEDQLAFNFIGHPRMFNTGDINPQLKNNNWKEKGPLVLGGDLDNWIGSTTEILNAYNDLLDFSDPNTIVTLGNHDYSNLEEWKIISGHEIYYTITIGQIVFFISDNQSDASSLLNDQLDLFNAVVDTVSEAQTFIFLSHKLLWLAGNSAFQSDLSEVPNGGPGNCWDCTNENNFYDVIYPELVKIKNLGLQVICLAGDVGNKVAMYEKQTSEGITFLANGWNVNSIENQYLKFFQTGQDSLRWELTKHDE